MPRLAACLLGFALACGGSTHAPSNVLLVTVDTLRADRLSAYGFEGHRTPHIDRLASEGALFENAFTDTPWTTPSMATVMTGLYPTRHGFKSTNANRLGLEQVTLAEILHDHGYTTAAVIGSFPLDAVYQLDQGFDHYDDEFTTPIWHYPELPEDHVGAKLESEFRENPADQAMFAMVKAMMDSRRTDAEVADAAIAWLSEARAEPFFLWVHFFGPHSKPDWSIPEEERLGRQLAMYDPDVRENDRQVGRLLAAVDEQGLRDDTLVIFHADHGESLGEQSYVGHGHLLNEATMRVPLILRLPGRIAAGLRVRTLGRNVDLFPTVLDAVGIPIPDSASGESLLPRVEDSVRRRLRALFGEGERVAYMETYYPAHKAFAPRVIASERDVQVGVVRRSIVRGQWQLVRSEVHPLLDVAEDEQPSIPPDAVEQVEGVQLYRLDGPSERDVDLKQAHPELVSELAALLDARLEEEREGSDAPPLPVDEETRIRLESLGYGE